MALRLYYKKDDVFVQISEGEDLSSPFSTVHNGRAGDTQVFQLFLRNDNSSRHYSKIEAKPVDLNNLGVPGDVDYTESGWGVKVQSGENEPSTLEWEKLSWGNTTIVDDIGTESVGDITSYVPIWVLITCPPNITAQNKTNIAVNVNVIEGAVI